MKLNVLTRVIHSFKQEDDVRKYVNTYRREFESKNGKKHSKAPKIQRLVTPEVCVYVCVLHKLKCCSVCMRCLISICSYMCLPISSSVECAKLTRAHFCLTNSQVLQRKRRRSALKKRSLESSKAQAAEYHKLLVTRLKEQRERR